MLTPPWRRIAEFVGVSFFYSLFLEGDDFLALGKGEGLG
jgi:hypothetical protein